MTIDIVIDRRPMYLTGKGIMTDKSAKTTYMLEMIDRSQLQPSRVALPELEIKQVKRPSPVFNWFLHQAVGAAFRWGGPRRLGRGTLDAIRQPRRT